MSPLFLYGLFISDNVRSGDTFIQACKVHCCVVGVHKEHRGGKGGEAADTLAVSRPSAICYELSPWCHFIMDWISYWQSVDVPFLFILQPTGFIEHMTIRMFWPLTLTTPCLWEDALKHELMDSAVSLFFLSFFFLLRGAKPLHDSTITDMTQAVWKLHQTPGSEVRVLQRAEERAVFVPMEATAQRN